MQHAVMCVGVVRWGEGVGSEEGVGRDWGALHKFHGGLQAALRRARSCAAHISTALPAAAPPSRRKLRWRRAARCLAKRQAAANSTRPLC
jgi:hypothetical protein